MLTFAFALHFDCFELFMAAARRVARISQSLATCRIPHATRQLVAIGGIMVACLPHIYSLPQFLLLPACHIYLLPQWSLLLLLLLLPAVSTVKSLQLLACCGIIYCWQQWWSLRLPGDIQLPTQCANTHIHIYIHIYTCIDKCRRTLVLPSAHRFSYTVLLCYPLPVCVCVHELQQRLVAAIVIWRSALYLCMFVVVVGSMWLTVLCCWLIKVDTLCCACGACANKATATISALLIKCYCCCCCY